jgi:hypothetical protein
VECVETLTSSMWANGPGNCTDGRKVVPGEPAVGVRVPPHISGFYADLGLDKRPQFGCMDTPPNEIPTMSNFSLRDSLSAVANLPQEYLQSFYASAQAIDAAVAAERPLCEVFHPTDFWHDPSVLRHLSWAVMREARLMDAGVCHLRSTLNPETFHSFQVSARYIEIKVAAGHSIQDAWDIRSHWQSPDVMVHLSWVARMGWQSTLNGAALVMKHSKDEGNTEATKDYHPILGAMMRRAPAFHTDTSLSRKAVQDYLRTKDIRIIIGTPWRSAIQ